MIQITIHPNKIHVHKLTGILVIFETEKNKPCSDIFFAFKRPPAGLLLFGDRPIAIDFLDGNEIFSQKVNILADKPGSYSLLTRRFNYHDPDGKFIQERCEFRLEVFQDVEMTKGPDEVEEKNSDSRDVKKVSTPEKVKDKIVKQKRQELKFVLTNYFNISELKDLCFDLEIDFEDLVHTTKKDVIRELIGYCERYENLDMLYKKCQTLRPKIDWKFK